MATDRVQRQVDRLLDEAEEAIVKEDWYTVASRARAVLRLDTNNSDERAYLAAAGQDSASNEGAATPPPRVLKRAEPTATEPPSSAPGSGWR